jgi:hypothetical protein
MDTPLFRPTALHFICSPARAAVIMSQVAEVEGWSPVSIYEPVPVRTVPIDHQLINLTTVIPLSPQKNNNYMPPYRLVATIASF